MSVNRPRLRPYPQNGSITIANNIEHVIERGGTFIRVRDANEAFKMIIDDDVELKAEQNDIYRFPDQPFKRISVVNDTGGNLTFQLEIGEGAVETNSVSLSGEMAIQQSNLRTHGNLNIGTTAAQLIAANPDRDGWIVHNEGSATIYIGSTSSLTTSNGLPVAPGAKFGWSDRAAVWAISGSSNQDVRFAEI